MAAPFGFYIHAVLPAEVVNKAFKDGFNYDPPFTPGKMTFKFSSSTPLRFLRIHSLDTQLRGWVFSEAEVRGLTLDEIKSRFGIVGDGMKVSEVIVPPVESFCEEVPTL